MARAFVDEDLWNEFHRVVNMSSRELSEWLRTEAADADHEQLPDQAHPVTGQQVLRLLRKRRTDLDADDARVMRAVLDEVRAERGQRVDAAEPEPEAGRAEWRRRLMSLGHDPLRVT